MSNLDEMGIFLERLKLPKHFEKEVAFQLYLLNKLSL